MGKGKLLNRAATWAAQIFAFLGAMMAGLMIGRSLRYGLDWYQFLPGVLYGLCFIALAIYSYTKKISSSLAFRAVLISYSLVLLVSGIIWPPVYPFGTKLLFQILAGAIIIALFFFDRNWADVKKAKILFTAVYVFEFSAAMASLLSNPMLSGDLIDSLSLFIRTIILSTFAVCYLTRMYEKSQGK